MNNTQYIEELKKILERYAASLIKAGVNADNVNYDILTEERNQRWQEIETTLSQALAERDKEIVEGIEKLQKYTGGSSVEPKDMRVKLSDIKALLTKDPKGEK